MKDTLIHFLKMVNVKEVCHGPLEGLCDRIDCTDCPFYSDSNMEGLIAELEALPTSHKETTC